MIMNSGKSVNQFGDPDQCRDDPNTEYAILRVTGVPLSIEIGLCTPKTCNSQQAYAGLVLFAQEKLEEAGMKGMSLSVTLPFVEVDHSLSTGAWIVIALTALVVVMGLVGIACEYLPIFEKPESVPTMKIEDRKSRLGLLFYSFSFKNNVQKLFEVSDRGDANLKVFNGIRVLSICWVVVGHAFMNVVGAPLTNITSVYGIFHKWFFVMVPGGFFAVDVFFFLSGFLTFYLLTAKLLPKKGCDNYPLIYFHRWFRLVTPAGYCILLSVFIFKYFGDGPKFFGSWNMYCDKYWWSSLLFINNLVPWNEPSCIGWFWYLANDFEFFLISPIIIFLY